MEKNALIVRELLRTVFLSLPVLWSLPLPCQEKEKRMMQSMWVCDTMCRPLTPGLLSVPARLCGPEFLIRYWLLLRAFTLVPSDNPVSAFSHLLVLTLMLPPQITLLWPAYLKSFSKCQPPHNSRCFIFLGFMTTWYHIVCIFLSVYYLCHLLEQCLANFSWKGR